MRLLVGEKNFHTSDTRLITKDFNKQFKNKRIVFCDEIQILKVEHVNKFKALINDMIEIEGKGENAVEVKNYASIYIASNNFDSIRLTDDDRRFSIIELTDEKLIAHMSTDQISSLIEADNIQEVSPIPLALRSR
jgi:phage/plasmid-associated DNA primase